MSAVKSGSGKDISVCKREDYSRRKELHEERQEEKRRLREEAGVQGVDLAATNLSRTPDFGELPGGYMGVVDARGLLSEADEDETGNKCFRYKEGKRGSEGGDRKYAAGSPDIFKGKITMGRQAGRKSGSLPVGIQSRKGRSGGRDERTVNAFRLRKMLPGPESMRDEDVFISHGESAFDDEGYVPGTKRKGRQRPGRKPRRCPSYPISRISPLDEPAADDDESLASMRRKTRERSGRTPCREMQNQAKLQSQTELQRLPKTAEEEEKRVPETEENEKTAGIPPPEEESMRRSFR